MNLRSRVDALEKVVGRIDAAAEPLLIHGGLVDDATDRIGFAAGQHFERDENETVEAFRVRVMAAAGAARNSPLFGGLPPMPMTFEPAANDAATEQGE
jgi:hypothetical protein